jgi:class 3 adenylate cyclase/tetratricopeptide (TPR) repeat protein
MCTSRRERKVVTCLFCDLVGFTARSEELDPENVAALLGPYQARLKEELERYGGTVEKFIGDAAMALFGAPTAHEDDAERAVRAALAIRDFAQEQGIELRIGITTGETLVNLDARPDAGETMATGDVLNTASRLETAAPVNSIFVSEKTYEATKDAIEYRDAKPVEAKGKAQPVPVWEAVSAAPLQERMHTTPLVGRERELAQLREALHRVREERAPQLVTIAGPPGIGKSRLVYELLQADDELSWRKGRCLPCGNGVVFWALGEIVKQHVGILESDSSEQGNAKLRAAVDDPWVVDHLRLLVGAGEGRETLGDRRAETFSAWRRFLTTLAEEHPLGLVLEDIHWADEGLLDFVAQLVEWARESPLFVLCTCRPELLERSPAWETTAIRLSPLSDDETERLLYSLVEPDAPAELVARAAGNPLYAEQYARLLADRGSVEEAPVTVQGIIADRLDNLRPEEKALLQSGAVVGNVFWSGALATLTGVDSWTVEERLLRLERREFVRRDRPSAVEGETQYSFGHVLLRDVAYAEIPRAERAEKHVRAAQWIESLGRPDDHIELLAHHYVEALELSRAVGRETDELSERARLTLREAGERALALGAFTAAARQLAAALELWPADDVERPYLLLRCGTALRWAKDEGEKELAQARDLLIDAGDPGTAAEAELLLADIALNRGRLDRTGEHLDRAGALVGELGASRPKAYVLGHLARFHMIRDREDEAITLGQEALEMADRLGLEQLQVHVLNTVGTARVHSGDPAGVEDLERSIELALALNAVPDVLRGYNNLAAAFTELGDIRRSRNALEQGLENAERFGEWEPARGIRGNLINALHALGDWEEALRRADEFVREVEAGHASLQARSALAARANIRLARDDVIGALADARWCVDLFWPDADPAVLAPWVGWIGWMLLETEAPDEAEQSADECLALARESGPEAWFPYDALLLLELGRAEHALRLQRRTRATRWSEAGERVLHGRLEEAADLYHRIGDLPAEARVRLRAAERLLADGHRAEAEDRLERSLAFWRSVGATRYMRQCEQLLSASA